MYVINQAVQFYARFDPPAGSGTTLDSVELLLIKPDGTEEQFTYGDGYMTHDTTSHEYRMIVALDAAGIWRYQWRANGDYSALADGVIAVRHSAVDAA